MSTKIQKSQIRVYRTLFVRSKRDRRPEHDEAAEHLADQH